jgi:hypothetical protein
MNLSFFQKKINFVIYFFLQFFYTPPPPPPPGMWMYNLVSLFLFFLFLSFCYCTNCFIFICLLYNPLFTNPRANCYCISSFHLSFLFHVFVNPSLSFCVSFWMDLTSKGWVTSPSPSTGTTFSFVLQLWPAPLVANASTGTDLRIVGILKPYRHIKERHGVVFKALCTEALIVTQKRMPANFTYNFFYGSCLKETMG